MRTVNAFAKMPYHDMLTRVQDRVVTYNSKISHALNPKPSLCSRCMNLFTSLSSLLFSSLLFSSLLFSSLLSSLRLSPSISRYLPPSPPPLLYPILSVIRQNPPGVLLPDSSQLFKHVLVAMMVAMMHDRSTARTSRRE
jgi:hypothetical protein